MGRRRGALGLLAVGLLVESGCGGTSPPAPPKPADVAVRTSEPAKVPVAVAPAAPAPPPPKPIDVAPGNANIVPGDDGLQLLASETAGVKDLTSAVAWKAEPAGIVEISPSGYVRPSATGSGKVTITASLDGRSGTTELQVAPRNQRPWDFGTDIVPILTRAGCNVGGCHGRAEGQNGFHLSLFGYDPAGDYQAITRDGGGRRVEPFDPESSLLIQKATGTVPHQGGRKIVPDSPEYATLLAWIRDGAPQTSGDAHGALVSVEVTPGTVRLDEPGPRQFRVVAKFADKHERDVTRLAIYKVNDDVAAGVDPTGKVVLKTRGETDLIVRYGSRVLPARIGTVINPGLAYDFAKRKRANFIDDELFKRLESLKVPPSPAASDAAFLRRVSLDLTGEQPLPDRVREYLKDTDPDKKTKLVDRLLNSREFLKFWQIKLGDLLEITSGRPDLAQTASRYQTWLTAKLQSNTPWDEMVRELLTTVGDPMAKETAAASYALDGLDPKVQAEKTAQRFLGLRIRCAQCHDHPFDVWTQDDYFGMAALFAKTQRSGDGGMNGRIQVKLNPKGEVVHLRTKQPAGAKILDGTVVKTKENEDPRKILADWMTKPDNPFFARAAANWAWAQMFGKGLADPADDLSKANPPVHPELLDALAKHFVQSKYNLRDLIRTIALSEAYGISSESVAGNERDQRLFSHFLPRPLTAHQMADALAQATDIANRFQNRRPDAKAIDINDPTTPSTILDTFGRCNRQNGCSVVPIPALSLRQSLLLIGGDVIESKVSNLNGYLSNMLELKLPPEEIVENLYVRTVCRMPTAAESERWSKELSGAGDLREAAEDLFWALLNSKEFAFNH